MNTENMSKDELAIASVKLGAKLYETNNGRGDLINKIFNPIKESHPIILTKIIEMLPDDSIYEKDNLFQKILLNHLFVSILLKRRSESGDNIVNLIVYCDNNLKNDIWLEGINKVVMPYILKIMQGYKNENSQQS